MAPEVRAQAAIYLLPRTGTLVSPQGRPCRPLPWMLSGEEEP